MILLSCRNWQKKEETGRVTFSCIADFAASRPSRYSGVSLVCYMYSWQWVPFRRGFTANCSITREVLRAETLLHCTLKHNSNWLIHGFLVIQVKDTLKIPCQAIAVEKKCCAQLASLKLIRTVTRMLQSLKDDRCLLSLSKMSHA
jgi:hypothetical protein